MARFLVDRAAIPAVALTTDTSLMTALGGDTGFDRVFSAADQALGRRGDLLVAMTTAASPNVLAAVAAARLDDRDRRDRGGRALVRAPLRLALVVPSRETPRVRKFIWWWVICCERARQAQAPAPEAARPSMSRSSIDAGLPVDQNLVLFAGSSSR